MFIGHFAVALGAKRLAPRLSLAATFAACQALDLIWPVLVLAGVERVAVDHTATAVTPMDFQHYPISHSLVMTLVWSAAAFVLARLCKRSNLEGLILAGVVASHWLLDFVTHRPDLPIGLDDAHRYGLGLWNSVPATLVVEGVLFGVGLAVYAKITRPLNRKGGLSLWIMAGFLVLIYLANVLGPKPPLDTPPAAIAGPALAMWLIVLWAYFIDKHRASPSEP